jgi:hypothetical protein
MEQWWNDDQQGKSEENWRKPLIQCQYVRRLSRMKSSGIELRTLL